MTYNTLIYDKDGAIGIVTLNRRKSLNAISDELLMELDRALDEMEEDEGIGAVIITGQEKVFGAGADITEIGRQPIYQKGAKGLHQARITKTTDHRRRQRACTRWRI